MLADKQDPIKLRVFKADIFGRIQIEATPGNFVSYLEGVEKHPGQMQIHFPAPGEEWDFYVAMWGQRSGKTIAAGEEITVGLGLPSTRYWIVAPNYDLTDRCFEYVWDAIMRQKVYGEAAVEKASKTKDNRYIEMKWGSWVRGKSGENPDSLVGEQLDGIVYDEAARCDEKIWLECLKPRLVNRQGWCLFISSPRGGGWFPEYFQRGEEESYRQAGWRSSRIFTRENPFVEDEYIEQARAEMPEATFRREFEASPEHFTGLVWPDFRDRLYPDGHLFDPEGDLFSVSSQDTHYRAVDIGWQHPTACLWGAAQRERHGWPGNSVLIYQEYEETGLVHEEHAQNIIGLSPWPVAVTWLPPDSKKRNPMTRSPEDRKNVWSVYRDAGIYARQASTEVGPGLATVARYFRSTLDKTSMRPRLLISTKCTKLRRAIGEFIFQDRRGTAMIDPPDKPRKWHDDLPDALRYLLATSPRHLPHWQPQAMDEVTRYGYQNSAFNRQGSTKKRQRWPGAPVVGVV